jgi:hypothetical protein
MSDKISLREVEKNIFKKAVDDGLWDILIGLYFLNFGLTLKLSESLGDFWSSAVTIPVFGLEFLIIWVIRKKVVMPRIGRVQFGRARKARLKSFTIVMLVFNVLAFVAGLIAAFNVDKSSSVKPPYLLGLLLLSAFSMAAYYLDFTRFYVYGLLVGLAPVVGEWLWAQGLASHHGFPVTFGVAAGIMVLVGVVTFVRLLRENPVTVNGMPFEEA